MFSPVIHLDVKIWRTDASCGQKPEDASREGTRSRASFLDDLALKITASHSIYIVYTLRDTQGTGREPVD